MSSFRRRAVLASVSRLHIPVWRAPDGSEMRCHQRFREFLRRRLDERGGAEVRAILTKAGEAFVTPLSVSALTGDKVYTDLFSLTDEAEMGHIEMSSDADLLVVAPATADLLAKMAQGLANDLASTTLLATDKKILVAPAMNVRMWHHPATQRNLARLQADGVTLVDARRDLEQRAMSQDKEHVMGSVLGSMSRRDREILTRSVIVSTVVPRRPSRRFLASRHRASHRRRRRRYRNGKAAARCVLCCGDERCGGR